MDRPTRAARRHTKDEETAAEEACRGTAFRNGFTIEQADNCDDGSVGCLDCPFRWEPRDPYE